MENTEGLSLVNRTTRKNESKVVKKRKSFTLAEVLIVLGIIGVIAAFALPNLFISVHKSMAETKLRRFYAEMNQAIKMAAAETGVDVDGWTVRGRQYNKAELDKFVDTFFRPYLNINYTRELTPNPRTCNGKCPRILVVLNNGIAFSMYIDDNGIDIFMHPNPEKTDFMSTRDAFAFQLIKKDATNVFSSVGSMEPYTAFWNDGKESTLWNDSRRGCNRQTSSNKQYCTKIIQLNGWKIPRNYPW